MEPIFIRFPRLSAEAITVGLVCGIATGKIGIIDHATQTTIVTLKPIGISATNATATDLEIAVVGGGDTPAVAGTGGFAIGDELVAEAATGKLITYDESAYTDGQTVWIVARALEAASADARGLVRVSPRTTVVGTP
jgi:hypothetical protein